MRRKGPARRNAAVETSATLCRCSYILYEGFARCQPPLPCPTAARYVSVKCAKPRPCYMVGHSVSSDSRQKCSRSACIKTCNEPSALTGCASLHVKNQGQSCTLKNDCSVFALPRRIETRMPTRSCSDGGSFTGCAPEAWLPLLPLLPPPTCAHADKGIPSSTLLSTPACKLLRHWQPRFAVLSCRSVGLVLWSSGGSTMGSFCASRRAS